MSKHHLKLLIWAVFVALVPLLLFATLRGLGLVLSSVNEGANPESALNIVPNVPPDLDVALSWDEDDGDTGRKMEPFTRVQVESAYLRAWLQWNISLERREPFGLQTYFTGPALEEIQHSIQQASEEGLVINQVDTTHRLKLHTYSADGSIVSFSDSRAIVGQVIRTADGSTVYAGETWASFDVVMLLQDGNWAVRHWKRTADATSDATTSALGGFGIVSSRSSDLLLGDDPFEIHGVNYYPSDTPWDLFWSSYEPETIERDLAIVRGLGLNSVRIFIPFWQFGGPNVDEVYLDKLDDFLACASANEIKVVVTLFDFRVDYRLLSWSSGDRHLEALIPRYRNNSAILAWDLKNEPDRDYGAGKDLVDAWLVHVGRVVRELDPNHLLTIGWSSPEAAVSLTDSVDLVSFHYYALAEDLADSFELIRLAAPSKPILLGEFGLPTWNSPFFPNGHTEREQATYFADVLTAMRGTDSAGYLAWTLFDFSDVPASVAGRFPWQIGPQKHLGVLRVDGTPKASAALLAPGANLDVPRESPLARFFKPFWVFFAAIVLGFAILFFVVVRLSARAIRAYVHKADTSLD